MAITARTEGEAEEQTPKKTKITRLQHRRPQEVDRISQLPDDILHQILGLLALEEACITSTLSKRWRNLFPSLPRLVFDDFSFCPSSITSHAPWGYDFDIDRWLESVWTILASRSSPVRICAIRSAYLDEYCEDFGNVVRFLCNDGIQELTIHNFGKHYTFPSCLYFCRTPTRIELRRCILNVPSKFTGLRRVTALKIVDCMVEDGDLQRLILGCGAVDSLTLDRCNRLRNLVVDAHKLAVLDVSAHMPLAVSIGKAPRLDSVTVRFRYAYSVVNQAFLEEDHDGKSEVSRLVGLLESLGDIHNLSLEFPYSYVEVLRTEGVAVPVTLQCLLPKMKKLTLKGLPCRTTMVSIVSCLLNSCPNLEDLVIGDDYELRDSEASALDYWDQQMPSDCMTNTLSTVTLYLDVGYHWKYWSKLLKFFLNNAFVLKNLVIDCYHTVKSRLEDFRMELLPLQPASTDAVVELKTARRRTFQLPSCIG